MSGHHHDDLGWACGGIEQQAECQQHQHQPALGIGGAEQAQDPVAPDKKRGKDRQGKDKARCRGHGGNGLGLAHLAGVKVLGDHRRDHQFDGKGEQGQQAGGAEGVEIEA